MDLTEDLDHNIHVPNINWIAFDITVNRVLIRSLCPDYIKQQPIQPLTKHKTDTDVKHIIINMVLNILTIIIVKVIYNNQPLHHKSKHMSEINGKDPI